MELMLGLLPPPQVEIPPKLVALADEVIDETLITLLGGGAAAWPLAARQVRRIGVLMPFAEDHPVPGPHRGVRQGLQQQGWADGRNVRIDYRWAAGDAGRFQRHAEELLVNFGLDLPKHLQRATRTVPIVFANVNDPVARPGGFFC
jgi:putative ABC transport system substrate-binding protein